MKGLKRFPGVEKKTVWFFSISLFIFVLIVLLVAHKNNYFSKTIDLYFFAPSAFGINQGMSVKYIGFKVGEIQNISMEPNATVKVKMVLNKNYADQIGHDARLKLGKESLMGENFVEVIPGAENTRRLANNDVLKYERGKDIGELVDGLANQLQPILADVKKITTAVSDADDDIRVSMKNIQAITAELKLAARQYTNLAKNGDQTIGVANEALKKFNDALPGLIEETQASMHNIHEATADLKRGVHESVNHISQIVEDSNEIMSGAKTAWPISTWVLQPEERLLSQDVYIDDIQTRAKE